MAAFARALGSLGFLLSCAAGAASAADGDPMKGKIVFTDRCLYCHAYPSDFAVTAEDVAADSNSPRKEGTPLAGLLGRRAGSLPDYFFSDSMKESGVIWTEETLKTFILSPRTFIKYNRMGFSGIQNEDEVDDLVAYLVEATKPAAE